MATFSDLPDDVVSLALSMLPSIKEAARLGRVSKQFQRLIKDDDNLWITMFSRRNFHRSKPDDSSWYEYAISRAGSLAQLESGDISETKLQIEEDKGGWFWCIYADPELSIAAIGTGEWWVRLYDFSTGEFLRAFTPPGDSKTGSIRRIQFDEHLLFAGSANFHTYMFDMKTSELLHTFAGHTDYVTCLQYRQAEQLLFTGGEDNVVNLWNVKTKQNMYSWKEHSNYVWDLQHNATTLATGGGDGHAMVYDLHTLQRKHDIAAHKGCCWSVKMHEQQPWCLLTGGDEDFRSSVWDLRQGEARVMDFDTHQGKDGVMTIGCEDQTVVSIGYDAVLRIWDMRMSKQLQEYGPLHDEKVWHAHIAPWGVATASFDGTASIVKGL